MGKWYGKYKVSSPSENALPGSTHAGCPKDSLHIFFLSQTKPKKIEIESTLAFLISRLRVNLCSVFLEHPVDASF